MLGIGGRGDDRGPLRHLTSAENRAAVHRHPRRLGGRIRLRPPARLPAAAPAEEHRLRPPVHARGRQGQAWPQLSRVLSARPIDWELIARQYDQMVKYATALRLGTAEAQQILRRFARGGPKHPTYQAIEELGAWCAPSSFATTSPTPALRQEIHEGLQVVENWNSANTDIFYGKSGDLTGPDREHAENIRARAAPDPGRPCLRQHHHDPDCDARSCLAEPAHRRRPARTVRAVLGPTSTSTAGSRSTWTPTWTSTAGKGSAEIRIAISASDDGSHRPAIDLLPCMPDPRLPRPQATPALCHRRPDDLAPTRQLLCGW